MSGAGIATTRKVFMRRQPYMLIWLDGATIVGRFSGPRPGAHN